MTLRDTYGKNMGMGLDDSMQTDAISMHRLETFEDESIVEGADNMYQSNNESMPTKKPIKKSKSKVKKDKMKGDGACMGACKQ